MKEMLLLAIVTMNFVVLGCSGDTNWTFAGMEPIGVADPPEEVHSQELTVQFLEDQILIKGGEHEYVLIYLKIGENHEKTWLGATQVPQWLWVSVMGDNPSRFIAPLIPVHNISLRDSCGFSDRLSTQLEMNFLVPTGPVWEFAATEGRLDGQVAENIGPPVYGPGWNINSEGGPKPRQVGLLEPNALGFYDMFGNVLEWTVIDSCDGPNGGLHGGAWYLIADKATVKGSPLRSDARFDGYGLRLMLVTDDEE